MHMKAKRWIDLTINKHGQRRNWRRNQIRIYRSTTVTAPYITFCRLLTG